MTREHDDERLAIAGGPRTVTQRLSPRAAIGLGEYLGAARVLWSGYLGRVDGQAVRRFESAFARAYGVKHAIASTSGTSALHTALAAVNPEPYSEVITSPITDMGSVIPIVACGCRPVFADVDPETGNLTAQTIAAQITPRTRAIILVHLFGRPAADLPTIKALADRHGLVLIEDCSQAHLAEYGGAKVGTFGAIGCFSFQQSKQMTAGEGGMTITNDPVLAERAALFTDKGWARGQSSRRYLFFGMNYRMTELQGAVGLAQLQRLPRLMAARRRTAEAFTKALAEIPGLCPPHVAPAVNPSWWKVDFGIDEEALGLTTDDFFGALLVEGVPVARHYLDAPIYECDFLLQRRTFGDSGYPLTGLDPSIPPYRLPQGPADLPGTYQFLQRRMVIHWSPTISAAYLRQIVTAFRKVARLLPGRKGKKMAAAARDEAGTGSTCSPGVPAGAHS
jgi:perosamine synthetase